MTVEKILDKQIDNNKTPSVIYQFFDNDRIIFQYNNGLADIAQKISANNFTTFNAYSVTKTFTATAILQLAQHEKINLDEPAKKYLPSIEYEQDFTVRQLLTHTAGLPNPLPLKWIHLLSEQNSFDRNKFFSEVFKRHNKLRSNPGEKFSYSNLGYVLLGQMIEDVSEIEYSEFIRESILQKAGIASSEIDFIIPHFSHHATGYQRRFSLMNFLLGFMMDKKKYTDAPENGWIPFRPFYVNGISYGGLIGSINGFVKYVQQWLKEDCVFLNNEFKQMLFTENFLSSGMHTGMCLSWFKGNLNGNTYFTHAGGGGGYYCEMRIYPGRKKGSVIMFNRSGMSDERFLDKVDGFFL